MDSPPKEETPNFELPNNENKLVDVNNDVGTSTISDLSIPHEDDDEEVKPNNVWQLQLISCLHFLHFMLKGNVSEMGQTSNHGRYGILLPMG